MGIVKKSGSWFSYNDERIGHGRDNARLYLKSNKAICEEIKAKIMEQAKALNPSINTDVPDAVKPEK
jgi:recombination protein RecA